MTIMTASAGEQLVSKSSTTDSKALICNWIGDPESLSLAMKASQWTIENMQDWTGYLYYLRYSPLLVNKTPILPWGQATMLCSLAGLHRSL